MDQAEEFMNTLDKRVYYVVLMLLIFFCSPNVATHTKLGASLSNASQRLPGHKLVATVLLNTEANLFIPFSL